jgi:aspartate/methionine/tyrosine aminotransferase
LKAALIKGIQDNRTHYVQTTGIPPLLDLLAKKMREKNGIPIGSADEVMVTSGGIHGVFAICQGLLEPGDEVLMPDPEWPPAPGNVCARTRYRSATGCTNRSGGGPMSKRCGGSSGQRRARFM